MRPQQQRKKLFAEMSRGCGHANSFYFGLGFQWPENLAIKGTFLLASQEFFNGWFSNDLKEKYRSFCEKIQHYMTNVTATMVSHCKVPDKIHVIVTK